MRSTACAARRSASTSAASFTARSGPVTSEPRAKRAFGFEASVDFREGLRRTLDWYRRTVTAR